MLYSLSAIQRLVIAGVLIVILAGLVWTVL